MEQKYNIIVLMEENSERVNNIFKKTTEILKFTRFYLAADNWVSNFTSFNCGVLPNQHTIRKLGDNLGVNLEFLPQSLERSNYTSIFNGDKEKISFAKLFQFKHYVEENTGKLSLENENLKSILKKSNSQPILIEHINNNTTLNENIENHEIHEYLKDFNQFPTIILRFFINPSNNHNKIFHKFNQINLNLTVSISSDENLTKYLHINQDNMGSIIDIAPNLLEFMKIKRPYTFNGKIQNLLGNIKENTNKESPNYRKRILFEYESGNKIMINESHQFNVEIGNKIGQIFNINNDSLCKQDLWGKESYDDLKTNILLEFLWAQLDKQVMPMPRIAIA